METQNNAIVKSFTDKLIYVEPNFISGGKDNIPVPLEDLCVYAELRVECNLTKSYKYNDGDFVLQMRVENDTPHISLYNGVKYSDKSTDTFLSTEGYDNYTLSGMKEQGVEELFGVESIEISYNSFVVPEVVIKFTDIKGAALHGAEELAQNSDGSFNANNMSLCSRFLSCFFTVPYPRFTLLVKGFYGKPVYYDLTCADFRSSFNSKSGNYDVTVRLVGYSFALISDVNVCSLLAAPYSQYKGKEYWKEQTQSGGDFFIDGVPMPTLAEIVSRYNERYASLQPLEGDTIQTTQQVKNSFDDYIALNTSLTDLMINLSKIKKDDKKLFIVDFENNKIFLTETNFSCFENNDVKDIVNVYVNQVNRIDTKTPFKTKDFFNNNSWYKKSISKTFDLSEIDVSDEVKEELIAIKSNLEILKDGVLSAYNIYYYDLNNEFEYLERQQKRLESEIVQNTKVYEEMVIEQMKTMLGFYPTIGNITKILFAHLETFLYMFEEVKKFNRNSFDGLFPKILEKNVEKNGVTTYVETWLGKRFSENDRAEVGFVHGLYNGIKNVLQSEYFIKGNGSEDDIIYAYHGDLFKEHPFVNGFKNGYNEDVFVKRFFQIAESANYIAHDNINKEIAINDAKCFHIFNPTGYPKIGDDLLVEKFLESISKVESGAYSTIYDTRFSKKIRFYEIKDALLYNKKIITSDKDKKVEYTTLNVDGGWSSLNFKYDFYFKDCTAILARISENPKEVELCEHSYVKLTKEIKYDVVLNYNKITRKYSSKEVAQVPSILYAANRVVTHYKHHYYKLSKTMSPNNMTLLTIPSFCFGLDNTTADNQDENLIKDATHSGILYGSLLFSEIFYKDAEIYDKAAMFLETFDWSHSIDNIIEDILRCNSGLTQNVTQLVEAVPYFIILIIGASIYSFYTKNLYIRNEDFKYSHFEEGSNNTEEIRTIKIIRRFKWDTDNVKKLLDMIPKESRNVLQNEFKKWVDNTYKKWDDVFMSEEQKLTSNENYNSPLYYVTVYNNHKNPNSFVRNNQDSYRPVYYRLFRETHPIVQEMTKQLFELKWLVKDNMNYIAKEDFYRKKFRVYAEAFNEEIGKIFSNVKENIRSQYIKNMTSPRDYIDLNLYRYLKQLWDRWIISGNGYNDWKMVDVFRGENKRIHFIDPTYNDVTNLIMVDIGKFVELIQSCKEHEDMPFLTFLSYYFRDNNCALHNVQNFINGQDKGNLSQIFDTVPAYGFNPNDVKKFSDLIVMFSFQGAESQEDSFNLNDVNNLPPSFNNHFGEYIIPSFGVAYGMQNQNYFTDVDVSMTTPNITDQVLQATFQIADENSGNASTENGAKIRSIGQDMYRVYSNHAYQCSVTMMGCAWVQPLMYFQLTNVPIFCGAYIIHKVTHSITPNNMVTKFVGTKVSKISMRRLENSYYYIQREISQREHNIYPKILASVTNNCNYAHFPPYSSDNSSDSKDLAILLGHFDKKWYSNLTYGIYYAIMLRKTKHSIEKNNLIFGLDVFLYNMWVANKASLTSETLFNFFNNLFIANSLIFVNPTEYEGKEEELVLYYEEYKDNINQILSGLTKCFSDIQDFVDKTANDSTIGFEQIDGCALLTSDLRQKNIVYCVGDGNIGDVVFLKCQRDGQQHSYWGAMYNATNEELKIENLIASFNKSMNESKTLKGVVLNISKNNEKEQKYVSNETVRVLLTVDGSASDEIKGQIFDMILQTYSQYLNHICWVVKDANSSHLIWDNIMIEMKTNNQFKVDIGYVSNINAIETSVVNSYDSLNVQFYMSIIKKYGIIKSGSKYSSLFDSFKNECGNFNKLNSKEKWKDEVLNFFSTNDNTKNIKIKDCDDLIDEELSKVMVTSNGGMPNISTSTQIGENFVIDIPSTQSFEGVGNKGQLLNKNQLQKITNSTAVASVNEEEVENLFLRYGYTAMDSKPDDWGGKLAEYAYDHATGLGGKCAKYVRIALEGVLHTNTYNFSSNGRPESACRYWQFLNYWGFTCIYHGMSSQYTNSYQNGDIIVSAGLINGPRGKKDKHGHIQIYYNGKWYCDKKYNNANVYSNSDRSCFIFRIPNTSSNDSSTSTSNANY